MAEEIDIKASRIITSSQDHVLPWCHRDLASRLIYSNQDTAATGEMSVDQDYLGARGASRLECAEKTDRTERRVRGGGDGEESVRRNLDSPKKSLSLSLSLSLSFSYSASPRKLWSNEGTDL